ncbi:MAG: ArdC-like ssDNA-binding domain-containing protein [Luteolibacter sp.]
MQTKLPPKKTSPADIYELVTQRVIELLEKGVRPWEPGHFVQVGFPRNFQTGNYYQGVNVIMLGMQRYASPWWLTFLQAKDLGGNVRKGEKGSLVVKYGQYEASETDGDSSDGKSAKRGFLKGYSVFNACQIEGVDFPVAAMLPVRPESQQVAEAALIVANMPNPPTIHEGRYGRAFYRPATDSVDMPARGFFKSEIAFYGTLFHELAHSTGHASRLARETLTESKGIGATSEPDRKNYSREELVAEMAADFLSAHAGILEPEELENSAAYLQGWISVLKAKDNRRWIISAASNAQKAADYILGRTSETIPTESETHAKIPQ